MALIVQKFGGTSVANAQRVRHVAQIIAAARNAGHDVVAVVSAQGKTTDQLIEKAQEITPGPPGRELDALLATGEQVSCALMAMALQQMGCKAVSLTGWQAGFATDNHYTRARVENVDTQRIQAELGRGCVVVVAGFQGVDSDENITTLGRGGSDTSAVAIAAAMQADKCQIYTDVDGIYTTDPRIVPTAQKLKKISFDEMLELASLGAKVLNHRSVELAKKYGVQLEVLSSLEPQVPGTIVKEVLSVESLVVTGVAKDVDVAVITVQGVPNDPGVAANIFGALADQGINVDIITFSRTLEGQAISFTVARKEKDNALAQLQAVQPQVGFVGVDCKTDVAKVSVVGGGMQSHAGVAAQVFQALAGEKVNILMISTSEIKISVLVEKQQADTAIVAIHSAFFTA